MTTDQPPPSLEQVAPGVFAYLQLHGQWGLNNTGFILHEGAVTLIDTCFTERRSRDLAAAVQRTAAGRPVRTLVNTHHHGDHTHGNFIFAPAAIVGHEKCREEVIATGLGTKALWPYVEWGDLRVEPPNITFADRLTLYAGDTEVQLIYVGPAHTTNDIIAWLPGPRVLFAGDVVFNGGTPFVVMGSLSGSLTALDTIREVISSHPGPADAARHGAIIVPGHGPVTDASVLDGIERYLRFVSDTARAGFESGLTPLELARQADLGDFAALHDSERLVANLHRAYAELAGQPAGAPIPPATIFPDMIAFNNGEMPRCLA